MDDILFPIVLTGASIFLSVLLGYIYAIKISIAQFESSTAGYRLQQVVEATQRLIELRRQSPDSYAGSLRNQYRYSLGVILDKLTQEFMEERFDENAPLPALINAEGDRWKRFNDHVRPVIVDINVYTFLSRSLFAKRFNSKSMGRLETLTKLCTQMETIVSLLDYAMEGKQPILRFENRKLSFTGQGDEKARERIIEEYKKLHGIWQCWCRLCAS